MKSKYLIFLLFLLIPFIAKSQDGSTKGNKKYWFNESQVRKMYEVKFELEFYKAENYSLSEHIRLQDNTISSYQEANENLKMQLEQKDLMYNNQVLITEDWEKKFKISERTIHSLKNIKTGLIIATSVIAVATIVAIIK